MKKKKIIIPENFLEKIPVIHPDIEWKTDSDGKVTLLIENKGLMNRIMQAVFLKPKISYIHLDELDTVSGKTSYKYYYDEESDAVVCYSSKASRR